VSSIDDLLTVLAHRRIGRKAMAEVFYMRAGSSIAAAEIVPVQDSDHPYPCYGGNGIRGFVANFSHDGDFVLVGRQGAFSGNVKFARGRFYATEHAVVFASRGQIDVRWAFYMLTVMNLNQYVSKGAQPGLAVRTLAQVKIPVPPVEVQHEIVRILDNFTELEVELETELGARRRQYAFYLDRLMTFAGDADVHWIPMGEIGEFIRGRRFVKDDIVDEGVPAIHYGEIYTRYGVATSSVAIHLRPELKSGLRYAKPGDVVIVDVGETVEDVGKAVAWLGNEDVAIHDHSFAFRHSQNPSYISYFLQTSTFQREKAKYVARTKVKTLSMPGIAHIKIPVPPLDEQERIVGILDKFDALVNDHRIGLPAEIDARSKQYQYYRDRLLTFKELAA
jgi:type I restriction enzyme S subunit